MLSVNRNERDVRLICDLAGIPYQFPHKLRHGHVAHALKLAHNMAELKAISQNVMHSSVTITDQVYGKLIVNDVQDIIGRLGKNKNLELTDQLTELLRLIKASA